MLWHTRRYLGDLRLTRGLGIVSIYILKGNMVLSPSGKGKALRWSEALTIEVNNGLRTIHEVKPSLVFCRHSRELRVFYLYFQGCLFGTTGSVPFFSFLCISLNQFRNIVLFRMYIPLRYVHFQLMRHVPADSQPVSCHHLQRCFTKLLWALEDSNTF